MNRIGSRIPLAFGLALLALAAVASVVVRGDAWRAAPRGTALAPQLVSWSSFTPTGWVISLPAAVSVTANAANALDPATAAYATSTDAGASWSDWLTENLNVTGETGNGQTFTVSGLHLPDSGTANLVRFRIAEYGGAVETSPPYSVPVDVTAPAAPLVVALTPGSWTNLNSFTVTWTNPADEVGVVGAWYKLDSPPSAWNDGVYNATTNNVITLAAPADGVHTLYLWLQDAVGRADPQATATGVLKLDQVAPLPPYALRGQPAKTWTNVNSFSESWTNPEDPSGIVGVYYQLNDVPGSPGTTPVRVNSANSITNIMVTGDAKHTLYLWLIDGAGNSSLDNRNVHPEVFWYDGAPPTSRVTLTPPPAASGWYTTTVTASFAGEDQIGLSGLQGVYWELDGWPARGDSTTEISAEGVHRLAYYALDKAGNQEPANELDFSVDYTPPTAALTPNSLPRPSGWYTTTVSLTLKVLDGQSGPAGGFYRINGGEWQTQSPFALVSDGIYRIEYYGQDQAGNRSATGTYEVRMDAQSPSTAYQIEGEQGANGWYTSPLAVTLVPSDGGSGVVETYYSINSGAWQTGTEFPLTADGVYNLSFSSVDASGNRETGFPVEVKVDSAPPAAPSVVETIPSAWSRTNSFAVKWANPTDLSGLAGVYYRLNQEPAHARDGVYIPLSNRLDGLTVPFEGAHRLYLWLQDAAGNASASNKALAPLLRYDATPPETISTVQGLAGGHGWYRSAVIVTLAASDPASGVRVLNYRINAGEWMTATHTAALSIKDVGEHVIEYRAEDTAGNLAEVESETVRLDFVPPPAPAGLVASPTGWHRFNSFGLAWRPMTDESGISGVYVKVGEAPTAPTDGTFYAGETSAGGITVPGAGKHDLWVWVCDGAGNANHQTAVLLEKAIWYDGTPPLTAVISTGTLGTNGWYRTPVSFELSATDADSGVAEIFYRVDDGDWVEAGDAFVYEVQGEHMLRIAAADYAGNVEQAQAFSLKVDTQAPQGRLIVPGRQESPSFEVRWEGEDAQPGAGMLHYDILWRDGYTGPWWGLRLETKLTSSPFTGQRGHTYFFRMIAVDRAGNRQQPPAYGSTIIDPVLNGHFDSGIFEPWSYSGMLYKAVVPVPGPSGIETQVARLGYEEYGPSLNDPGSVPVGSATISQQVWIPDASQARDTCLTFAYRVFSYDVSYSQRLGRFVDTLDVTFSDAGGAETLLYRTGNPTNTYGELYDSGWRQARIDVRAWAGQTVTLAFANHNRNDNLFNTWSYVDDIRVRECRLSFLPSLAAPGTASAAAPAVALPAEDAPAGRR
jgi:hypothetical protein